tara:strand:- start:47 stop:790 length:744 start_codon:yes stop_codon:yes gene_type:complete
MNEKISGSNIDRIILAVDDMTSSEVKELLKSWPSQKMPVIKVGLELFLKYGQPLILELFREFGVKIFLDLKLHDIPNTVAKSIRSLKGLPIEFLTIHLSGGREMIKRALEEAKIALPETKVLGVSLLTSLGKSDFKELWDFSDKQVENTFKNLFSLALELKVHGVVCSPIELKLITPLEEKHHESLIKVTPGIRFEDEILQGSLGDQKRVLSPKKAFNSGSDYLVIGRSLTKSAQLDKRIEHLANLH